MQRNLLILFIFLGLTVLGSKPTKVSGVILDKHSNEKLTGALIHIDSTTKVYSNSEGIFQLTDLPPGKHKLKVSFISYKDLEVEIKIPESRDKEVTILLEEITP